MTKRDTALPNTQKVAAYDAEYGLADNLPSYYFVPLKDVLIEITFKDEEKPIRKILNPLRFHDIHTLNDLRHYSSAELLGLHNIGKKSVRDIKEAIYPVGGMLFEDLDNPAFVKQQNAKGEAYWSQAKHAIAPQQQTPESEDTVMLQKLIAENKEAFLTPLRDLDPNTALYGLQENGFDLTGEVALSDTTECDERGVTREKQKQAKEELQAMGLDLDLRTKARILSKQNEFKKTFDL